MEEARCRPIYDRPNSPNTWSHLLKKSAELRARGIITPEQVGSYEADATRVAFIRKFGAHVVPAASASLTEERALLPGARRAPMELGDRPMRGGTITPEEDERRLEMIRSRLEDIPAGYANGIAEAARRADGINQADAAVGVRLCAAITEAVEVLVAVTADKTGRQHEYASLTLFDPGSATRRAEAERISKLRLIPLADVARLNRRRIDIAIIGVRGRFEIGCQACSSPSSAFASFRSRVLKPSVNHP